MTSNSTSTPAGSGLAAYPLFGDRPLVVINILFWITILGQVLVLLLICTLCFSKRFRTRNVLLVNFLTTVILFNVSPWLLYYAGQIMEASPSTGLCLAQASIKHGIDMALAVSMLSLITELFCTTKLMHKHGIAQSTRRSVLLILPWIAAVVSLVATALVGGLNPNRIQHQLDDVYCVIESEWLGNIQTLFGVVWVIMTVVLEIWTVVWIRKKRSFIQRMRAQGHFVDISLVVRTGIFTIFQVLWLCISALNFYPGVATVDWARAIYQVLVPFAAFLIFGLTRDCLISWHLRSDTSDASNAAPSNSSRITGGVPIHIAFPATEVDCASKANVDGSPPVPPKDR